MPSSKTKTMAQQLVTIIGLWVPTPATSWPAFTPKFVWVPVEELDGISGLVVNVAPGAISGEPMSRAAIQRTTKVAIQIAKKLASEEEADSLLDLVERLDAYLYSAARLIGGFGLQRTEIQTYDWKLLENKRVFHTVLIATFKSLESP